MNHHIRKWKKIFTQTRGPVEAEMLSQQIQQRSDDLLSRQISFPNRTLQSQWEQLIAPGLALYQTLSREKSAIRENVLDEVERLFEAAYFVTDRRLIGLINLLPQPFSLVRLVLRQMTVNHYLPGASEVIEDSRECFAANTYRCFILDTLTAYDAAELTPLYCKTDDWLAASLPKVHWMRTQTLANGGDFCDFRWCRQTADQGISRSTGVDKKTQRDKRGA